MPRTPVEVGILVDLLIYGDDKAENIGRRTGFHRNSVSARITKLAKQEELLEDKGGGVYRLTDKGREAARGLLRSGENPYQSD